MENDRVFGDENVLQPCKWNTSIQTKSDRPIHIVHIGSSQLYNRCRCAIGIDTVWCDFLSSRHWVTWLSSWRTPNLNIPKDCCFLGSISPMNQFSQTTFEVSGWCHLTTRQSMPYSAQVPCGAILVGSCLGGPSGHGPWWWEPKCLSSWIWRWDQQQMKHDLYYLSKEV